MIEKSFVFLKPDAVERHLEEQILGRFRDAGLTIEDKEELMAPDEIINKHYPLDNREYLITLGHRDVTGLSEEEKEALYQKNYKVVRSLQEYVQEGPIIKMIISGENAVARIRELVGKTDPAVSPKGTIRGDFGTDSFAEADKTGRSVRNLIHASGTPEEAKAEINLWYGK